MVKVNAYFCTSDIYKFLSILILYDNPNRPNSQKSYTK